MKKYVLFVLLLTLFMTGCSSPEADPPGPVPVRIANVIFPGGPPQGLVMLEKGILSEKFGEEYEVVPVKTRNIDRVSREMKNEEYDFIFAYYGTIAEYASNLSEWDDGGNFVMIANISNGPGNKIVAQQNITDISQLDGKSIGIFNADFAALTIVVSTLRENGLDITETGGTVTIRRDNSGNITSELNAGTLDALMARPSFQEPGFNTIRQPHEMAYKGAPPYQVLMVRKGFLEEHPDAVEKLLAAHIEATEWIINNREETAEIVWNESEEFYKAEGIEMLMPPRPAMDAAYSKMLVNVYPNTQFLQDVWSYMETYNPVKPYPLDEVFDPVPLNNVLKEKGMLSVEEYNKKEY